MVWVETAHGKKTIKHQFIEILGFDVSHREGASVLGGFAEVVEGLGDGYCR